MDVHNAADRWNDLLERTFLLWEECRRFGHEAEAATEVRGGTFATLGKVAGYTGVLEAGIRKAMDDVTTYRHGGERGLFGEDWLKRMEERLRREEGPNPDDPRGPKGK
jgi:hypothetical protein